MRTSQTPDVVRGAGPPFLQSATFDMERNSRKTCEGGTNATDYCMSSRGCASNIGHVARKRGSGRKPFARENAAIGLRPRRERRVLDRLPSRAGVEHRREKQP